jgi:hypothetical protein
MLPLARIEPQYLSRLAVLRANNIISPNAGGWRFQPDPEQ